jgi:hypothetical protein
MMTYFHLASPDDERLIAKPMQGVPAPTLDVYPCPISANRDKHIDGCRRVGDLAQQVDHNDRNQLMTWSGPGSHAGCLVHEGLLEEFESRGLTGYRTQPATLRFRDGRVTQEYRELVVTGWGGMAHPASGIQVVEHCPSCRWKRYSPLRCAELLVDWKQWNGEDFFIVWPLPGYTLITGRVADLLLSHDVHSFELAGLDNAGRFGFSVGRLSGFLPLDLALKFGAPLGLE